MPADKLATLPPQTDVLARFCHYWALLCGRLQALWGSAQEMEADLWQITNLAVDQQDQRRNLRLGAPIYEPIVLRSRG